MRNLFFVLASLFVLVVSAVLVWLFVSFALFELNPREWNPILRLIAVGMASGLFLYLESLVLSGKEYLDSLW